MSEIKWCPVIDYLITLLGIVKINGANILHAACTIIVLRLAKIFLHAETAQYIIQKYCMLKWQGGSPPPTHIFLKVARDHISKTTVAISIKQETV